MAVSAFSIDITLPLFGQMRDSLGATSQGTQATVTLFILGMGCGHLIFGALADRYGRRPAIVAGLTLYLAGAVLAIFAAQMEWMWFGRWLQGVGAATGPVCARAILRDRYQGVELGKSMAVAAGIFSVGPMVAPLIGVAIAELGGSWRMIFVAMIMAAGGMLLALNRMPETLKEKRYDALSAPTFFANAKEMLADRQSRYFLLLSAWTMVAMLTIIAGMPRIMEAEFGISGALFALLFAAHGLGIIAGQIANHKLIDRIGIVPTAIAAAALMCVTFTVFVIMSLNQWLNGYGVSALVVLFAVGFLIVYANSVTMVMQNNGHIAGFAAAFFGFMGQLVASVIGMLMLSVIGNSLSRWGIAILFICLVTLLALWYWQRTQPDQASEARKPA